MLINLGFFLFGLSYQSCRIRLCLKMFVSVKVDVLLDLPEILAFLFQERWETGWYNFVEIFHVMETVTE